MTTPPTIFLTSLARVKQERGPYGQGGIVGEGPVLGIMRWPQEWACKELLQGHVVSLMPRSKELAAVKGGEIDFDAYRGLLLARWNRAAEQGVYRHAGFREPGKGLCFAERSNWLLANRHPHGARWDGMWWIHAGSVPDGATLCCACAEPARCHRSVAAEVLARAGWRVVLDGQVFETIGDS